VSDWYYRIQHHADKISLNNVITWADTQSGGGINTFPTNAVVNRNLYDGARIKLMHGHKDVRQKRNRANASFCSEILSVQEHRCEDDIKRKSFRKWCEGEN
jgi:hypothetical protein